MKKLAVICLIVLISINLISIASAITGSIGNARMILREIDGKSIEVGDVIEKYVLVKNVNNVSVDIELFASGDLQDDIEIISDKFTLAPGEDRKAYFEVKVTKPGTTESSINVKFTPQDGKNGVGLTSTIIIVAKEGSFLSDIFGGDDEEDEAITGSAVSGSKKISPAFILVFILMFFFLILLLALLVLMIKKKKKLKAKFKKRVRRNA